MTLLEDLQWRGLVADCTDTAALAQRLASGDKNPITLYCGFDPTGDSLHVGHLMGQLMLRRFQLAGHHVLPLAGGATGMIGDPSGKSAERNLLTREQLDHNVACIKRQLSRLLDFDVAANPARLVDNATWTVGVSYLDFLRDIGKHFSLNVMLAKDSVRSRLAGDHGKSSNPSDKHTEIQRKPDSSLQNTDALYFHLHPNTGWTLDSPNQDLRPPSYRLVQTQGWIFVSPKAGDHGMSYTEFSYQLLQAFDFLTLRQTHACELQIGGSDQWGNITAGTDLIRKKLGVPAWGLTFPLITKSDGTKFGKTEGGAVWLDPQKTSPYKFYQFFVNTEDSMVVEYLKKFTLLPRADIETLAAQHQANPGAREAHRALAREVTQLVHGQAALDAALKASEILFGGPLDGVTEEIFQDVVGEVPTKDLERAKLEGPGTALTELLVHAGLCPSKGQARKDLEGGGIYLNNARIADAARAVTANDLLFGKLLLLRKGKRTYAVLNVLRAS